MPEGRFVSWFRRQRVSTLSVSALDSDPTSESHVESTVENYIYTSSMSRTFTKLFSSITESTVWCEPDRTRLLWICMLAMADRNGRVWGSIPGLSNRARIPVEDARVAIATFLAPDPDSRTPDHEGRRIEVIDGGWRLLNHDKYRAIRDEETTNESKRNYINARRAKERAAVEQSRTVANNVGLGRDNAEAEAEADTSIGPLRVSAAAKTQRASKKCPISFSITPEMWEWAGAAAPLVDVDAETAKMRDHTFKSPISDWVGAWRNWIRRAAEASPRYVGHGGEPAWVTERDERISTMTGGALTKRKTKEVIDVSAKKLG